MHRMSVGKVVGYFAAMSHQRVTSSFLRQSIVSFPNSFLSAHLYTDTIFRWPAFVCAVHFWFFVAARHHFCATSNSEFNELVNL